MAKNINLNAAAIAKNDEFYTQFADIEKELENYKEHFKDKTVDHNCDNPEHSNFIRYFSLHFDYLGLKKLIATHYDPEWPSYNTEIYRDKTGIHTETKRGFQE